jgi:hypothetical protein
MSELDKYKEIYNKFVQSMTDLHNANVIYQKGPTFRNGITLRRILRNLRMLEKELWTTSIKASREVLKSRSRKKLKEAALSKKNLLKE